MLFKTRLPTAVAFDRGRAEEDVSDSSLFGPNHRPDRMVLIPLCPGTKRRREVPGRLCRT